MGKTIFLNTHDLSDVEKIADRVGILDRGELVAVDRVADICGSKEGVIVKAEPIREDEFLESIGAFASKIELKEGFTYIELENESLVAQLLPLLKKAQAKLISVEQQRVHLEDYFKGAVKSRGDSWVGPLPETTKMKARSKDKNAGRGS
jgi:ABC-2 type transport system ATP-binding protein